MGSSFGSGSLGHEPDVLAPSRPSCMGKVGTCLKRHCLPFLGLSSGRQGETQQSCPRMIWSTQAWTNQTPQSLREATRQPWPAAHGRTRGQRGAGGPGPMPGLGRGAVGRRVAQDPQGNKEGSQAVPSHGPQGAGRVVPALSLGGLWFLKHFPKHPATGCQGGRGGVGCQEGLGHGGCPTVPSRCPRLGTAGQHLTVPGAPTCSPGQS